MLTESPFKPTILVTDASRGSSIAIIRSLGRRGWRVIAAEAERPGAGMRSRYAARSLLYPSPEAQPGRFVDAIYTAAREHGVDLVVPVTDAALLPLAHGRERFSGVCQLAIPSAASLELATNKMKTVALAQRLAIPCPKTRLVKTVDAALGCVADLGWPVVVKPQVSRLHTPGERIERFSVSYAEDAASLEGALPPILARCPVLLQEYCPGEGHGVELLVHEGQPLAAFQHRRLREMPVHGGPSALRESVPLDPVLYDQAVRLLAEIGWTGLAMVEFKVGSHGPRLMEINGRVWGSLPLAVHAGMDFPARLVELLLHRNGNRATSPATDYRSGVRSHNLELELKWIATVLRGKANIPFLPVPARSEALIALAQLFHPTYKHDILSIRDPLPGLMDCIRVIRGGVSRLTRPKQAES